MLASELDDIEVAIAEVLLVGQESCKHAIGVRGAEREDQGPVKQPACLVEHAHWALCEPCADHILDFTDRGKLSALTRLLKLDFAGEQAPEDLRDKLIVGVGLRAKDFFQNEQVVVSILILLTLKQDLGVVEEVLAVLNGDFVGALAQLLKVKLAVFAHLSHILVV